MSSSVLGVAPIVFGLLVIFTRRGAGRVSFELDYWAFGTTVSEPWHEAAFVASGVAFIVIGILASAGILVLPS